jgi:UDP-N-acetylglucosamine--N-acetylmuramyl-(pentapeptide) pyrophosphoryl-undecaprenol N-acetylglucosamine transferase
VAIPESDLTPARLESEVTTLLQDDGRRHAMAAASRALGRPDAADRVADALLTTIEKRGSAWNASARS